MENDVNGDEAMKNLDDLTDKLFGVKREEQDEALSEDDEVADD